MIAQLPRDLALGRPAAESNEWEVTHGLALGRPHHTADGGDELIPPRFFHTELLPAGRGQAIILELSIHVAARLPLAGDPPSALQAVERWVERAVFDGEDVACGLANVIRDAAAMDRPEHEGFQDEHVERTLEELDLLVALAEAVHE